MRDPNRIPKVLGALRKLWEKYPDLRLGQLLDGVFEKENMFYIEDDVLQNKFKRHTLMNHGD